MPSKPAYNLMRFQGMIVIGMNDLMVDLIVRALQKSPVKAPILEAICMELQGTICEFSGDENHNTPQYIYDYFCNRSCLIVNNPAAYALSNAIFQSEASGRLENSLWAFYRALSDQNCGVSFKPQMLTRSFGPSAPPSPYQQPQQQYSPQYQPAYQQSYQPQRQPRNY